MSKLNFSRYIILGSLLLIGCFFVTQDTKAEVVGPFTDSLHAQRHGVGDSADYDRVVYLNDFINYQGFEFYIDNARGHGHGISSKWKVTACFSNNGALWQGPCIMEQDNDYRYDDGQWRDLGINGLNRRLDLNDRADFRAVAMNIYVMDMEVEATAGIYGRRPSIGGLGAFSSGSPVANVRINEEIEVRWSSSETTNVELQWVVPGLGEGSMGVGSSGSESFIPTASGTAAFRIIARGPSGLGREATEERDISIGVEGTMAGNLSTNMDGQGRRCTLDASAQNCHIQVSWNASNAQTVSIQRNGGGWVGPTGSMSGMQRHDDPAPGSYTYTLYGTAGSQTLQLDQATVIIEPYTPGAPPPPPPPGAPSCNPGSQTIGIGGTANFSASGGNGTFTWSAPYGSPSSGSGTNFSASYGASGFRQVTVTSGGQSAVCNVNISSAPPPADRAPVGYFDSVDNNACSVTGWALDQDTPSTAIEVHIYQGGPYGTGTGVGGGPTNTLRSDVNNIYGVTGNHGFTISMPESFKDGVSRSLYIHGINSAPGGSSPVIGGSPRTIQCNPPSIPPCQETVTFANTPYGYGDYAVFGQMNTNYWLADPYDANTNASNIDRSTNKIGISTRPGLNYPAGQSRGIYLTAPAGGTIRSVSFNYHTNAYDPNMARMSVDYTGVSPFWYLTGSGNMDTRGGALTTVTFPGNGVAWTGLYYYQQNTWASAPVTFADFYNISMVVSRPCNPSVTITADNINLNAGQSTLLRWTVTDANALSANINPGPGAVYLTNPPGHGGSGTFTSGALSATRTYTITATRWDNGQPMSASVTVYVNSMGNLTISCNGPYDGAGGNPDAEWQIRTGSYSGPVIETGNPPGRTYAMGADTYYITFNTVPGWTSPGQRTVVVGAGGSADVTGCDYASNQASINVNSISARTLDPLAGAWNISGPGGVNRNRTGTSQLESDLLPSQPYTITAQAITNCIAGQSYGLPTTNPATVNTIAAGGPAVSHNIAYTQGQFSIHATVTAGNWSISPNPSGCTGTGSGTGTATYYRAPGNYTITAPTIAGFNAPVIRYGSGSYPSPHVLNVTSGSNTPITIEYSAPPPAAPTAIVSSNFQCNTLNISWLDNSSNETGFRLYYRNTETGANNLITSVGPAAGTGTRPSYLWTNPPAGNLWIVVAAFVDYGGGNIVEGASVPTLAPPKKACTPSFNGSYKELYAINGTLYTSNTIIKEGDVLTFRIMLTNAGTDKARVTTIADTLSDHLERPSGGWNLRADLDNNGVYNSGGPENSVNATGQDDPTININRNKCTTENNNSCLPAEDPACVTSPFVLCNNWMFLIDAQVTATVPNVRTEISNEALINYDYPVGSGSGDSYLVATPRYLIQTIRPRVPQFREITP